MARELKVGAWPAPACPRSPARRRPLSRWGRFEQLCGARTLGFMLSRLAISYTRSDGARGTMLFDASAPAKGLRSRYRGRTCSRWVAHERARSGVAHLPKPFRDHAVIGAIQQALEAAAA